MEGFLELLPGSANEGVLEEGGQASHSVTQGVQGHPHQAQHLQKEGDGKTPGSLRAPNRN